MTAIVGVLNKQAIAVAADSAVTVGAGVKIYDKANKIFTLSKHHPVGVAIYSSASFNSCIPWEIIIKMFRKKIGKDEHETIQAYADDFISYLSDFKDNNTNVDELNSFTSDEISKLWAFDVLAQMPNSRPDVGLHKDDIGKLTELFTNINANISNNAVIPELSTIDKPSFVKCYNPALKLINKEILAAGGDQKLYDLVEDTFFNLFTKDTGIRDKRGEFTGISFFGYGSKEIFPSLYRIHVYNCINGIMYWRMIEYNKIENMGNQSYICPMAQIDEMQTYITGINPVIENTLISGIESIMKELVTQLATSVHSNNPIIAKNIAEFNVTPLVTQYKQNIQNFKRNKNIAPLINTVSTMAKEDLAELAENLIYMTSLKRHITPNLESVGGPVDVAVISKGDGFIWMKRKHYFDPSLNKCFFDNYYDSNIK